MNVTTSPPPWMRRAAHALLLWTAASIPLSISGMEIGIVGLVALAVLAVARGGLPRPHTTLDGPLVFFFGVLALSTLVSGHPAEGSGWSRPWVAIGFLGISAWVGNDRTIAVRFVRVLIVAGAVAGVYGVFQHYTGADWYRAAVGRQRVVRPREAAQVGFAVIGFFRNYLTFAHAMLLPLACALGSLMRGRPLGMIATPPLVLALVFSTARGAWLGAIGVLVVLILLAPSRRTWVAGATAALVAIATIGASPYLRGHAAHMFATDGENAHRLAIYATNLDIVAAHPVFGLGFGRYARAAQPFYDGRPLANRRSHAHSNPLQIAAEAGLVGLGAFVLLFARAFQLGWRQARAAASGDDWIVAAGACAGIVGFFVAGLTQYNFGDNEVAIGMWTALALVARDGGR